MIIWFKLVIVNDITIVSISLNYFIKKKKKKEFVMLWNGDHDSSKFNLKT